MISFIVVTYNSAATIADCLQSVIDSSANKNEIIVVDNDSSDETMEIVRSFEKVTLISLKDNIGFGGANQIGFKASHHDVVVFLNPDTVIQSGFEDKVLKYFCDNPTAGILGVSIINADGSLERTGNTFPSFFSLLYEYSIYKYLFPKSRAYQRFIIGDWDRTTARSIDVVSGACFAMQRETLSRIGGFDPGFFLYFEEYDLGRRVKGIGKTVFYDSSIQVRHIGQVSTTQMHSSRRQEIYNSSCRRYVMKHHGKLYATLLWSTVNLLNIPKTLLSRCWRRKQVNGDWHEA